MQLSYDHYLDQVLGGWIGKSLGGAAGARFEGYKGWIEVRPEEMFPAEMPPNDDLDLQVLWLKVIEEKGAQLTADDLATAWLEGCWYPFNEYGIFRRNWRMGIHPPYSGRFTNQFWETGEGCPIRAEIWGYVFPGAPDLAAHYAALDGCLDHTEQSIGAEQMLAAMSSMAFFVPDVRRLASMFRHHLPAGSPVARLTEAAFAAYESGLSLRDARDRIMALEGLPEACDAQINIPFTFLGLLYGGNDLEKTLLSALACGYDTDCTMASAAALVGQILGASRIPAQLKAAVGDQLVMGIQYRRPEMTLSALARDTARMGVLLARDCATGVTISGAPEMAPLAAEAARTRLRIDYDGLPCAAPGERKPVTVSVEGPLPGGAAVSIRAPEGWKCVPERVELRAEQRQAAVMLHAPRKPATWPWANRFEARLEGPSGAPLAQEGFGVAGAGLWKLLGVYYDALPDADDPRQQGRRFNQHFVALDRAYLPEPAVDAEARFAEWSRKLGQPALVPSYEHEVDPGRLVGLRGPYCAYLSRTILSPEAREVYFVIGNNDAYRLYLNGACAGEADETVWWAPFNNVHKAVLRAGENHLLLKLVKRGETLRFTLGVRCDTGHPSGFNGEDWVVDLEDAL